jgi:hypothetical protein
MTSHETRLQRLEAVLPRWPATVEAAKQRTLARLHVRIGELTGATAHPIVRQAQAWLADDTPGQRAQDLETLRAWSRAHPELSQGTDGARDRLAAKLDTMARRLEAKP